MIAIQPSVKREIVFNTEGKNFDSLQEYRYDAVRIIKNSFGVASNLFEDEEAISVAVCALIEADYAYDDSHGASRRTYRYLKARFALKNYTRQRASSFRRTENLNGDDFEDSSCSPVKICLEKESLEVANQFFNNLSPRKKEMVEKKSRGMSYSEIASDIGTSRQNVQQTIKKIKGDFVEFRKQRLG